MPLESLNLSVILPASPEEVFNAWLDGKQHEAFTGSKAAVEPVVGGHHMAWDGYISGRNLVLEPGRRIVQSWRTTEFEPQVGDSTLELVFEAVDGGTELRLNHTALPENSGEDYRQGWIEYYFEPMKKHFARNARTLSAVPSAPEAVAKPAKKAAPAKKKPAAKAKPIAKKAAAKKPAKKAARKPAKKASAKAARKPVRKAAAKARKPAKKAGKRR